MVMSQILASHTNRDIHQDDDTVDWCHIQESLKILLLAMAQIELSLTDGEHNVTELGSLFTNMAKHLDEVNTFLSQKADTPAEIISHGTDLAASINEGVVAFQFYDRVSQRLQHVIMGLALMEEVLNSKQLRISPDAWTKLQEEIQASYSLDCERKMFDLVLQGTSVHEALKLYRDENQSPKEDDIELF